MPAGKICVLSITRVLLPAAISNEFFFTVFPEALISSASAIPADGSNIFTWDTIAPSSIDIYQGNIPGWRNSLLVTSLKYGMYRLKLKSTGDYVAVLPPPIQ